MKLIIIVFVFAFSYAEENLKNKKKLSEALDVFKRCGGWGKEIKNMEEYDVVKRDCYLTFRFDVLCCIEKPDCPEGLFPETPIFPNFLYPIESLELGCVERKKEEMSFRETCATKPTTTESTGKYDKKKTMT